MSTYVREKVLRIPFEKLFKRCSISDWFTSDDLDDMSWLLEKKFPNEFEYATVGKFQTSPTEDEFIDFVLEYEWDSFCGDFGKVRDLYNIEKENFLPVFQRLNPDFTLENMDNVKVVEFCWYNCCEAPNYYDVEDDDFYKEIKREDIK
nr:MAG TPA: hypothetical protein [Caudoviricetes sp.]